MIWLYRLLFIPLLLVALPYYLRRMFRRGGYAKAFYNRFGHMPEVPSKSYGTRRIWIQAVSVGELKALPPFINALKQARPDIEFILSTTTSTGYALAHKNYADLFAAIVYFPIDAWPTSSMAWNRIEPDLAILMESELWPEHLYQAKSRNIPILLLNARLSDRSFGRYMKVRWLAGKIIGKLDGLLAGSLQDLERYCCLGANLNTVHLTGNIKLDVEVPKALTPAKRKDMLERTGLNIQKDTVLLLGSSTWEPEEAMFIELAQKLKAQGVKVKTILVPRHAERKEDIKEALSKTELRYGFYTDTPSDQDNDLFVADTTGQLAQWTQLADIVFIGKSLEPSIGGQSPVEAAVLGKAIVYGPQMSNFRAICQDLESMQAAVKVQTPDEAQRQLERLISDTQARDTLGKNALCWHAANQGASQRAAERVLKHLS